MHSPINKIKLIVKEKIGLDSNTIGDSTLEKIITQRMHQCGIDDFEIYCSLVKNSREELSELLEVAVIPETWFFRDIKPFEIIYKTIKKHLNENSSSILKILSIPSSTGEEPYSLAMYLIDKGIDESRFTIDAVDISTRALQCAEQGLYGNNSFRGKHYHAYQNKHFIKEDDFYKIKTAISKKVKFYQLNILQGDPALKNKFDVILCRNLLIYFDIPTKLTAFNNLSKFLKDDGYLFIGHSEFGSVPDDIFQNTGFEQAFALIKHSHPDFKEKKPVSHASATPAETVKPKIKEQAFKQKVPFESLIHKTADTDTQNKNKNEHLSLIKVRELANSAEYKEAESLCHQYIDHQGENAESLFLLGLIANSQNKSKIAESLFRKCLFLEPRHYESLAHLSLLLQKNGDLKSADLFKKRADRALMTNQD
ncbi:MAG: hypothetical protein DIZ80_14050 [endosymbiont of Galathealinum brachiosum]|uniref:CheR-type methyltransferase domain-containing protein n=1 Tax=endosymbiont of Galathealinum brachiosum TaxID=2200906 RepID=A0A370DA31_9GAMM|nr:MAG: hypothetical protein DIZ80_14050 [endosymbiont of Galathealinum brachiosum]